MLEPGASVHTGAMPPTAAREVRRWDRHGREHVVRLLRPGVRRHLVCGTCGWRRRAPFLVWLTAADHLERVHQATVDPAASTRP